MARWKQHERTMLGRRAPCDACYGGGEARHLTHSGGCMLEKFPVHVFARFSINRCSGVAFTPLPHASSSSSGRTSTPSSARRLTVSAITTRLTRLRTSSMIAVHRGFNQPPQTTVRHDVTRASRFARLERSHGSLFERRCSYLPRAGLSYCNIRRRPGVPSGKEIPIPPTSHCQPPKRKRAGEGRSPTALQVLQVLQVLSPVRRPCANR
jgi:hypothetical protein